MCMMMFDMNHDDDGDDHDDDGGGGGDNIEDNEGDNNSSDDDDDGGAILVRVNMKKMVHVLVNTNAGDKQGLQDQDASTPDNTATRWSSNSDNVHNNADNSSNPRGKGGGQNNNNKMSIDDIDPEVEATGSRVRGQPRVEIEESAQDGFSGAYPQLKKWALPGW
ncbi:hypothetical protein ElyMa_002056100 [Elysia marginata]|uniref:CTNNB1 binding N-teminal domain-containing protein n=1 Tax=Elysia marginata TaxID=1093978 RepID=A0AAV4FAH8_9GAST|nr:hypothetical protein ElyMa_002056100 [Elysia marginata]